MRTAHFHLFAFLVFSILAVPAYSLEFSEPVHLELNFANGDYTEDIFLDNNLLYIYSGNVYLDKFTVTILDVSNLQTPVELGRKMGDEFHGNAEYANRVQYIENNRLSASCYAVFSAAGDQVVHYFWDPQTIVQIDDMLYEFHGYHQDYNIYKITAPDTFEFVKSDTLTTIMSEISGIVERDKVIYISTRFAGVYSGLILLDVANPDSLAELPSPIMDEDLTGLMLGGNTLLVGIDFGNITELNISDPHNPVYQDNFPLFHDRLKGLWYNNSFYLNGLNDLISIYDSNVNLMKTLTTIGNVTSFIINNNHLFAATNIGVEIYDVTDSSNPIFLSACGANISRPVAFVQKDNLLYFAMRGDGLNIVDISLKSQPRVIGQYDLNGFATDIKVAGNYILIADYIAGLVIMDGSDPANPVIISTFPLNAAMSLDIMGNRVFVLTDENKLYVIDISDAQHPSCEYNMAFSYGGLFGEKNFSYYKKVAVYKDNIWIKLYESPIYAFLYDPVEGLIEKFSYEEDLLSAPSELKVFENFLFLTTDNGMQIIDPENYTIIKEFFGYGLNWFEWGHTSGVTFDKTTQQLYVSMFYSVDIYDLKNPYQPVKIDSNLTLGNPALGLIYDNNYLYCMTPKGLSIYQTPIINNLTEPNPLPAKYGLVGNFPNPFNAETKIVFSVPDNEKVTIEIYNCLGKLTRVLESNNPATQSGYVTWDGKNDSGAAAASGVYFCRLISNKASDTVLKLVLLK